MTQRVPLGGYGAADRDLLQIGRKVRRRLAENPAVFRIGVDKAEIWALETFLDPIECGRLIMLIDQVAQPSLSYAASEDREVRTSYSGYLDPRDPFVAGLQARIDELLGLPGRTGEALQGQRYTAGQHFKPHIDWFPPTSPGWQNERTHGGQRAITAMAYLNTVEQGGETDFPELDIAIRPNPGTLIVWNNADEKGRPNPWTVHSGNPVVRGTKYIVTRWYRCRDCGDR